MFKSFILEGPDNAGKSTLAAILAKDLGMHVHHQSRPGSPMEFFSACMCETQPQGRPGIIYDRSMAISQIVYDKVLKRTPIVAPQTMVQELHAVVKHTCVIICLPPKSVVVSAPDDRAEMEGVVENRAAIYDEYAELAEKLKGNPNVVVYDYTTQTLEDVKTWLLSQDLQLNQEDYPCSMN